jgi:hypothetical protein
VRLLVDLKHRLPRDVLPGLFGPILMALDRRGIQTQPQEGVDILRLGAGEANLLELGGLLLGNGGEGEAL